MAQSALGDLGTLLEEGSRAATSRGKGAAAAAEAAAEEDAESAAVAPDLNALAGDELDDSLAEMVASLDAPVRPPAGSVLPKTLTSNGIKAPGRPPNESKPKGRPGRKRAAGGAPPAWLVDTSGVDFVQMHSEGRLSKVRAGAEPEPPALALWPQPPALALALALTLVLPLEPMRRSSRSRS